MLTQATFIVKENEIVALLGRNGAGKTTSLRSVMGLTPPKAGSIKLRGTELIGKQPFEIARLGIGYAPDDRRIFPTLTVEENLVLAGRASKRHQGNWSAQKVFQLFPHLDEKKAREGQALSGGEQKMLAIGRGLMTNPALLLLDEPSEGLAPIVICALAEAILEIRKSGVAILLADQNIRFCKKVCERGYIMDRGVIHYEGEIDELWQSEEIIRKHLAV